VWPTILPERVLTETRAFQVSRWRGGRYAFPGSAAVT